MNTTTTDEIEPMTTHKVAPVTKEQALKALEDMDDFASMAVSVNAFGARETLRRFIEQATPAPSGEAVDLDRMVQILKDYRCQYLSYEDGGGMQLNDVIANVGNYETVEQGNSELELLADHILSELVTHPPAAERGAEDAARKGEGA